MRVAQPNEKEISDGRQSRALLSLHTSYFILETPSPPGSVALFPQGFAFYVSHHHSLHSSFNLLIRRLGVGCSAFRRLFRNTQVQWKKSRAARSDTFSW